MEIQWVIDEADENCYRQFVEKHLSHEFVKRRITRNVENQELDISRENFWRVFLGCLLTTQQKSGVGSKVSNFLQSKDELLKIDFCLATNNIAEKAAASLSKNGLRFSQKISVQIQDAANWLKMHGYTEVQDMLETITKETTAEKERAVARFLQEHFKGLGPKQSRNLIQWMGLSKYEIPIDSRMIKLLNEMNFPVRLSPSALSDENYYCFIENGIQQLMQKIDVLPCVFDACAFASAEKGQILDLPPFFN